MYRNERQNNWVLGWFHVNDKNKVKSVSEYKHGCINNNRNIKISQSDAAENEKKTGSNTPKDQRQQPQQPPPSTKMMQQKKNKRKKKKHKCQFCAKQYVNKQEKICHENKQHKFIKPFKCGLCGMEFYGANMKARHNRDYHEKFVYKKRKKVNFIYFKL